VAYRSEVGEGCLAVARRKSGSGRAFAKKRF
jgi:hypothetical protein